MWNNREIGKLCSLKEEDLGHRNTELSITRESENHIGQQIRLLNRLKEGLFTSKAFEEELKCITDGIIDIFSAELARIWIISPGDRCDSGCCHAEVKRGPHVCRNRDRCLILRSSSGLYSHIDGEFYSRIPFGCNKVGRIAKGQESKFLNNDIQSDSNIGHPEWAKHHGLTSFAGYRLISVTGEPIGVIAVFSKHPISQAEDGLLENLSITASQIIQNAFVERERDKTERFLTSVFDSIRDGISVLDADLNILRVNQFIEETYSDGKSLIGRKCYEVYQKRTSACPWCPTLRAIETGVTQREMVPFPEADHTDGCIDLSAYPLKDDQGRRIGVIEYVKDVTERKKAERALKKSEEKYRGLYENMRDGCAAVDMEGRIVEFNPAFQHMLGYDSDQICRMTYEDITPRRWHRIESAILKEQVMIRGYSDLYEKEYIRSDGTVFPVELRTYLLRDDEGRPTRMWAFVRDIEARKRANQAINESEEKYRLLFASVNEGILMLDMKGEAQSVNPKFTEITGYEESEIVGKSLIGIAKLLGTNVQRVIASFKAFIANKVKATEWTIMKKGNIPVDVYVFPSIIKKAGKRIGVSAFIADISEQKRAEEALKESEEKYRTITENINVGIYRNTPGPRGRFLEANPAIIKMFGFESKNAFMKMKVADLYVNPTVRMEFNEKILKEGYVRDEAILLERKDGNTFWGSVTAVAVRDGNGKVKYYDGVIEDITERRKADELIKSSLQEKVILLKEIHHRVKNNLQIISSLLNLQANYIEEPGALKMFNESRDRVRSMALIHEKLYGTKDLAMVDFAGYIRGLTKELFKTYRIDPNRIGLRIDVKNIQFNIDMAVPCGLIINELVSNALKYAFPQDGRAKGQILVSLKRRRNGQLELMVSDDGVGLPQEIDLRHANTLGLRLITILGEEQLGGEITCDRSGGTTFRIRFQEAVESTRK